MRKCWEISNCSANDYLNCPAMQTGKSCWMLRKCFKCKSSVSKDSCSIYQEHKNELHSLVKAAQQGDTEAMEELIIEYSRFVFQADKKYFIPGASKEDLYQEGMIGLFTAIKTYDETRNLSFEDYLSLSIRNAIIRAVRTATQKKQLLLTNAQSIDDDINVFLKLRSSKELEDTVFGKFKAEQIRGIINHYLSKNERKVIMLKLSNFSMEEICSIMDEEKKTVENALYRARKKIKIHIENYGKLPPLPSYNDNPLKRELCAAG